MKIRNPKEIELVIPRSSIGDNPLVLPGLSDRATDECVEVRRLIDSGRVLELSVKFPEPQAKKMVPIVPPMIQIERPAPIMEPTESILEPAGTSPIEPSVTKSERAPRRKRGRPRKKQ